MNSFIPTYNSIPESLKAYLGRKDFCEQYNIEPLPNIDTINSNDLFAHLENKYSELVMQSYILAYQKEQVLNWLCEFVHNEQHNHEIDLVEHNHKSDLVEPSTHSHSHSNSNSNSNQQEIMKEIDEIIERNKHLSIILNDIQIDNLSNNDIDNICSIYEQPKNNKTFNRSVSKKIETKLSNEKSKKSGEWMIKKSQKNKKYVNSCDEIKQFGKKKDHSPSRKIGLTSSSTNGDKYIDQKRKSMLWKRFSAKILTSSSKTNDMSASTKDISTLNHV